jgi:DNA polymerase III delta prime subunit
VRSSAPAGGFASARTKVLEGLEHRLDSYVEDVLAEIHADDGVDHDRARAFLEIAAELCGLIRDEKAAQIVRRRAAVA